MNPGLLAHTHAFAHLAKGGRLHMFRWKDKSHKSLTVIMVLWQSCRLIISQKCHCLGLMFYFFCFFFSSWWPCSASSVGGRTVPERPCPMASPVQPPAPNPSSTFLTWITRSQLEERLKSTKPSSKPVCRICSHSDENRYLALSGSRF